MKALYTLKTAVITTCLLFAAAFQMQGKTATVNVATAGTLSSLIPSEDKYLIDTLTVTGYLNGTDIKFIRDMGGNVDGYSSAGILKVLNMTGADIVAGGSPYYTSYSTTKDAIGYYFFAYCDKLKSIAFPDKATVIYSYACYGCSLLTSLTLPTSLTTIGSYGLYGCTALKSITLPDALVNIGERAFESCGALTSVVIPSNVTNIGAFAFKSCSSLGTVTIPDNVTNIGMAAFQLCTALVTIKLPAGITSLSDGMFWGCVALKSVTLPEGLTSIGGIAFYNCSWMTSIVIPNSVTSIGASAFENCSHMTSATIGKSVANIGSKAFYNCTGLKEFHSYPMTPPSVATDAFTNSTFTDCKLYVPTGTYAAYRAASVWVNFADVVEESGTGISQTGKDGISVLGYEGGMSIDVPRPSMVAVCNSEGQTVYNGVVEMSTQLVLKKGVYMVAIGKAVFKVLVY